MVSKRTSRSPRPPTAAEKLAAIGLDAILEQVAGATFYHDIAQNAGVSRHALMNWLNEHEDMYATARDARAHKLAEDMLMIADDIAGDVTVGDDGVERVNHEVVARSRLRVDTRKWLASKMLPKTYGDRTTLAGDADNPIAVLTMEQITANPASRIKV